jgi:hypothetical protein
MKEALFGLFHEAGAKDLSIYGGQAAVVHFDSRYVAPLAATYENEGTKISVLRSIVEVPEARELFGVVEVNDFEENLAFYGLSRIARRPQDRSIWQGPLSKRITVIHPKNGEYATVRDLPWCVTFTPGYQRGDFAVNYRGDEQVTMLAAPANGEQLLTDLSEDLWLPDTGQLIAEISPSAPSNEQ